MEWTFTGVGSLIHPFAMMLIACGWIITWLLGLKIRQERQAQLNDEGMPLLGGGETFTFAKRNHHKLSAGLLFLTVLFMCVAMFNTYLRAGKLFPGPHLYGAFWFIIAASANVALVPWLTPMPRSRTVHVMIGFLIILLLVNQIWSGIPILRSVWKKVFSA